VVVGGWTALAVVDANSDGWRGWVLAEGWAKHGDSALQVSKYCESITLAADAEAGCIDDWMYTEEEGVGW